MMVVVWWPDKLRPQVLSVASLARLAMAIALSALVVATRWVVLVTTLPVCGASAVRLAVKRMVVLRLSRVVFRSSVRATSSVMLRIRAWRGNIVWLGLTVLSSWFALTCGYFTLMAGVGLVMMGLKRLLRIVMLRMTRELMSMLMAAIAVGMGVNVI